MGYQNLLCTNIKNLRLSKNMTQAKFAETIGLSVEAVRNIEHQKYTPSANTIDVICSKFGLSPIDLLVGELSDEQSAIISIINDKLKDCDIKELNSISAMIDIIRLTYKH